MAKAVTPACFAKVMTSRVEKLPSEWVVWRWRSIRLMVSRSRFLRAQPRGIGWFAAMASVMFSFIVMEDPQGRGQAEQFVMGQAEFPAARMLMAKIIVDSKSFIQQDSIRLQGLHQRRKKRPMQIEEHQDDVITVLSQAEWP